jgi:hemolysin type calcium-binding protein
MSLRLATATLIVLVAALAASADRAAAASTVALDHGTLTVTGDAANDALALRARASGPRILEVDLGDDGTADAEVKLRKVQRIRVRAGGGDDAVRIDESAVAFTDDVPTTIDGEDGFDSVRLDGSAADDRLRVSAKGTRVRFSRDAGCHAVDLGGVEQVDAAALGGADTVTVDDTTGTDLQELDVDLEGATGSGAGDGRRDRVILNGTPGDDDPSVLGFEGIAVVGWPAFVHIQHPEPTDRLTINGRGGDDLMSASSLKADAIGVTLDGGPGADVLFGGDGADVLIGGPEFDDVRGNKGDDVVDLGSDIDRFIWNPGDGNDVVDGQGGHDVLFFFGTNDAEVLDLSAQGHRLRLSRDVANVVMDLDDMEEINPVVNGGADTIAVGDLSATGVDEVNVNLEPGLGTPGGDGVPDRVLATGTDGDDAVTVAGANGTVAVTGLAAAVGITHAEGIDSLAIDTRAGHDTVDATGLAPNTIQLTTD